MVISLFKKYYCPTCKKILKRKDVKKWDDGRYIYNRCTYCGHKHAPELEIALIELLEKHDMNNTK